MKVETEDTLIKPTHQVSCSIMAIYLKSLQTES